MPNLLDHAKAIATGGDADRLAGRREVRQKLAPLLASRQRLDSIREQLKAIDQREAKTVASHESTTGPLQSKMLEIEAAVTDAILKDEPVGDKVAKERTAILEKIATANSKLEAEVESLNKLRKQYQIDLGGHNRIDQEIRNLRSELRGKLGSPKLREKQFVNRHAFQFSNNRVLAAEEGLRDAAQVAEAAEASRAEGELPDDFELGAQRELSYWAAEQTEAAAINEAVLEEKQRLRDRLEEE